MEVNPTLTGQFLILHRTLTRLGFDGWHTIRECDVLDGCPHVYAVFLRFIYARFPLSTSGLLRAHSWFLVENNDVSLGTASIRALSETYHWTAAISGLQFAKRQFAVAKIAICLQLVQSLRQDEQRLTVRRTAQPRVYAPRGSGATTSHRESTTSAKALAQKEHAVIQAHRSQLNAVPRT